MRALPLLLLALLAAPSFGTPLVSRDTSGTFTAGLGETEVPSRRTRASKTFRLSDAPDGRHRYRIGASMGPIHYRTDPFSGDAFQEIDLDVSLTPGQGWDAACEANGYQIRFWQSLTRGEKTYRYVAQFRRANRWLAMAPIALVYENTAGERQVVSLVQAAGAPTIDNDQHYVQWNNAFGTGLHFRYNLTPDKFFKTLVITDKANLPTPTIGATGRRLSLVMALEWDNLAVTRNGFAAGVTTALSDDYAGAADETSADPNAYDQYDGRGSLWWVQRPMAWDSATPERNEVPVAWRLLRRGTSVFAVFSVTTAALNSAQAVYPVYVDTAITEEQVGFGTDDGYARGTTYPGYDIAINNTATATYIGSASTYFYSSGMRFQTVPIPQGATVDTATLSVMSNGNQSLDTHLYIYCDAVDDTATLSTSTSTTTGHSGLRVRTTAYGEWTIGATSWTSGEWYTSGNINGGVQEIVDRAGWVSGNDLMLLPQHYTNSYPAIHGYRMIYTYEQTGNVSGPKFNATYTEGATSTIAAILGVPYASISKFAGLTVATEISKVIFVP